jgi:rubrerythrin
MLENKKFQRKKEDFTCLHCGHSVIGNGYTNHCPACLWSLHVDVNPGDRAAECGGLMEPVALEIKNGNPSIVHRCQKCGFIRRNRCSPDDDRQIIAKLSARPNYY